MEADLAKPTSFFEILWLVIPFENLWQTGDELDQMLALANALRGDRKLPVRLLRAEFMAAAHGFQRLVIAANAAKQ